MKLQIKIYCIIAMSFLFALINTCIVNADNNSNTTITEQQLVSQINQSSNSTITLQIGEKYTIKNPQGSKTKYTSSNSNVASVSKKGVVVAKKAGKAKITVTQGKIKTYYTINVSPYLYDIVNNRVKINKYVGSSSKVIIPESIDGLKVTEIGSKAFTNNTKIKYVSIPNSVSIIGSKTFSGCDNLSKIKYKGKNYPHNKLSKLYDAINTDITVFGTIQGNDIEFEICNIEFPTNGQEGHVDLSFSEEDDLKANTVSTATLRLKYHSDNQPLQNWQDVVSLSVTSPRSYYKYIKSWNASSYSYYYNSNSKILTIKLNSLYINEDPFHDYNANKFYNTLYGLDSCQFIRIAVRSGPTYAMNLIDLGTNYSSENDSTHKSIKLIWL